jgi:hypothetical protein
MQTSKKDDFRKFAMCMRWVETRCHLTRDGLIQIVETAQTMNRCKPRPEMIRILRDYTPDVSGSQELLLKI